MLRVEEGRGEREGRRKSRESERDDRGINKRGRRRETVNEFHIRESERRLSCCECVFNDRSIAVLSLHSIPFNIALTRDGASVQADSRSIVQAVV